MKIEYDQEADALYVQFRRAMVKDNVDVAEGVSVDLDKNGRIVGVEVLWAREVLGPGAIAKVSTQGIPLASIQG